MSVKPTKDASPPESDLLTAPKPSQFTYQDFWDLNDPAKAYLSPLSTIGLVDQNAFFAQVEQIRLGLSDQDPVVCAQWQSLIAVSYAARKFGIGRMDSIKSAKEKCPKLIVAHAAVYKRGESHWSYIDGLPDAANHKVSLDTYRRESRKIVRLIQQRFDLVEKASVDESYIDFGRKIYEKMLKLFPELSRQPGDPSEYLPTIPDKLPIEIQWEGVVIPSDSEIQRDDNAQEQIGKPKIEDWDDICLIVASKEMLNLRKVIHDELGYTTSAGLARNKLMAKLAGGFKKPDNQTIIRNCALNRFLTNFELTDITGMGGKLGENLMYRLEVPADKNSITYIRDNYTLEMLQEEIKEDPELALKIYQIVRGLRSTELTSWIELKSMTSTKNYLPQKPLQNLGEAYGWLKVFAGDLYNRLIDLDYENLDLSKSKLSKKEKGIIKRPKTLTIGIHSTTGIRQTMQMSIPCFRDLDRLKEIIEDGGYSLLRGFLESATNISAMNGQITMKALYEGDPYKVKILPLRNMSLSVSNFTTLSENALIESYATKNNTNTASSELKQINESIRSKRESTPPEVTAKNLSKSDKEHISKMFEAFQVEQSVSLHERERESTAKPKVNPDNIYKLFNDFHESTQNARLPDTAIKNNQKRKHNSIDILRKLQKKPKRSLLEELIESKFCPKCKIAVDDALDHNDFHIAMELSEKLNGSSN
ncbi:DNA polymerase eta subunit [Spathaspora passalidarum NRRL Y-27907]|uniref:DNA polymerase eta subunit n=1 Tax=Spathaspora passalidarum (strain NRRL Y-27907 / 11-Y1) TaxID=619300 RepID=G3AMQ2_SPAPN|nr:DNA polymerase eta subunit [Spathaspora passalidarum NRRL Y-27907]EGW33496.1 DNA polymerase eta subunit [Spathaspora passalidarum NRRL Y-27907]